MCLQFLVEEGGHIGQFDIARQMRFADCTQQDERQRACIHLLVVQHVIGQSAPVALETQCRDFRRQSRSVDRAGHPPGIVQRKRTAPRRITRRQHHAERHAFAIQQAV